MEKEMNKKFKRNIIIGNILIFIAIIIVFSVLWCNKFLAVETFSQVIYHLKMPLEGSDSSLFKDWLSRVVPISIVLSLIYMFLILRSHRFFNKYRKKIYYKIRKNYIRRSILLLLLTICYVFYNFNILDYVYNKFQTTDIYSTYYIDPKEVEICFENKKRNLIHLSLESIENTYMDNDNGGVQKNNYMPELTELAKENINFSHNDNIGGPLAVEGTQWTIASQVATNMGLPLTLDIDGNSYDQFSEFLPGGYSLGEILAENGYINEFMCGSDVNFAGTSNFYKQHGNYIIRGYNQFIENGEIPSDYFYGWGIEDCKLFELAKKDLIKLANSNKPFNFEIATIDAHAPDGFPCEECENKYDSQYANVIACQSKQVMEFISWCQKQSWYDDTTIVITGDHQSMAEHFFKKIDEDYVRTTYNCFINSAITTKNLKNRKFSTMDLYPTILASMGATINGQRLGLGTNLFSNKATLIERLDYKVINNELKKTSEFYNEIIIGLKNENE